MLKYVQCQGFWWLNFALPYNSYYLGGAGGHGKIPGGGNTSGGNSNSSGTTVGTGANGNSNPGGTNNSGSSNDSGGITYNFPPGWNRPRK